MHFRRILFVMSLATSAMSLAYAKYQPLYQPEQSDRLEELAKTLSQQPVASIEAQSLSITNASLSASTKIQTTLRPKTQADVILDNAALELKQGSNITSNYTAGQDTNALYSNQYASSSSGGNLYSWLQVHPLPDSRVSSNYGMRTLGGRTRKHSGIDLAARSGTAIYATGPGVVTKSGWGRGYGNYIEIDHGNGYTTRYAHASRLIARVGNRVSAGQHIANVGCTGRCTGPHLHYEVVRNGKRQNPAPYLAMLP